MRPAILPARQAFAPRSRPPLLRVASSLKLSRDLAKIPVERYRLPKDGRKWKSIARQRMALAEWLAGHGDGDGSRIFPSAETMTRHFGWSRRKTFYLLADLLELRLLESTGHLTEEHGTRVRRMNMAAFTGEAGVQDSQISPRAGVQDSIAGVQSNVAHNRHHTVTTATPPYPPAKSTGGKVVYFEWYREVVCVRMGRRKRLLNDRDRELLVGGQAQDVVDFLKRRGFDAWVEQNASETPAATKEILETSAIAAAAGARR